jgi:hypothetical protein
VWLLGRHGKGERSFTCVGSPLLSLGLAGAKEKEARASLSLVGSEQKFIISSGKKKRKYGTLVGCAQQ